MKKIIARILIAVAMVACACYIYYDYIREREFVVLSTNDIHASIDNFARLAEAVDECRDTVATLVVDAGDRWTGNAYVDLADGRRPILDLMNYVGYDAATLGNHEFDCGQRFLGEAIRYCDFPILCANMQAADTMHFPKLQPYTFLNIGGAKVMLVGVVTNYDYGHPDGNPENFAGFTFTDPQQAAEQVARHHGRGMLGKRAVKILLSHMGDERDIELAQRYQGYDLIVSGHTHKAVDTLVGRTVVGQTERKLEYIGVTHIVTRGRFHVKRITYENRPLAGYEPDDDVQEMVDKIKQNPRLAATVGILPATLDKIGLANMETALVAKATGSEIGFYHYGGIRLTELPAGKVSVADVFNLEPFESHVYTMQMTREQMEAMVLNKFNDTQNLNESHRIDLFCTAPYKIYVRADGDAERVEFYTLQPEKIYKVGMCDYIAKKYQYEAFNIEQQPLLVTDIIAANLRSARPLTFDNAPRQEIVKAE